MFGRRSSSPRQGPSLKERKWDDKSGMQNVTEGPTKVKEKSQGCLDIIAAGTTQHNMTKTRGLRNGRHPEGNCSYPTVLVPLWTTGVSALWYAKAFIGETLFLEVFSSFYFSLSSSSLSPAPPLPPGRDMFLSAASVPVTLLHGGSQSGRSPLSSSILFASKIVCTWKMWSCVAPSCRRRWNSVESLMHTNLCRWCSYCWKMDCLIKHIIRHICCLASQIEVVFCTNFLVKFVNVHVIFALGHRARCKFLASLLVASQFRLFLTMKWISLRIRHSLYGEERKTAGSG